MAKENKISATANPQADASSAAPVASAGKQKSGGKRAAAQLTLTMPLARARRLAGDLYEAAGLAFWTEALERADDAAREEIMALQEAVCEAGDLFKAARSTNPGRLNLYLVACYGGDDVPATPPRFITAANEEAAIKLWKLGASGKGGRRKPRALKVPPRGDKSVLHD